MLVLREATAGQTIQLGKFVDETDGRTAETALTIAASDIKLFKHNATSQVGKNSGGATHMANGYYYATLDATDTNTVGRLEVTVDATGALPVRREFSIIPAHIYDAVVTGEYYLPVDAHKILWSLIDGLLTVKKVDNTTTAYTRDVTADPNAAPVTGTTL